MKQRLLRSRGARALVWFGLLAWVLGGLALALHDLRALTGHHAGVFATDDDHPAVSVDEPTVVQGDHACPLDGVHLAGSPESPTLSAGRPLSLVRPRADRLPAAPRGPPPLDYAPKTSPPSST